MTEQVLDHKESRAAPEFLDLGDQAGIVAVTDLFTPSDAAAYLHATTVSLWRWVRDDKMSHIRICGRKLFVRSELDRVLSTREVEG